jgi:hypothetical protein
MNIIDIDKVKKDFINNLQKLAQKKITNIDSSPLKALVVAVANEYIEIYTMVQYSSTFIIPMSDLELINQVNSHCKKILVTDYDYSGFVRIDNWNVRVDDFEHAMYNLYKLAKTITIPSDLPKVNNTISPKVCSN